MKTNYVLILLWSFVSFGCNQIGNNDAKKSNSELNNNNNNSTTFWEKLEMKEIGDGKGNVAQLMPMPASWNFTSEGIAGPNGLKITYLPLQSFMISYDPSLQYVYQQSGVQMREMPGFEQLVKQDFIPWGKKNGLTYVKNYEIPEISTMDKWYFDQLYKAMPSRTDITAHGIEWKNKDGDSYFTLVHLNVSTSNDMQNWFYMASGLEADPSYFESAKKQYIFSLANTRYNLEPIMEYNKLEAQKVNANWAAFNSRIAQNQANFEETQRQHVNNSNAINDAIMNGWKSRNASSDKNQEQFIDAIKEDRNVYDETTSKTYKVADGANQYWMNNDGEYISTQLQDYNPNLDDNMNDVKWKELKKIK